MNIRGGGHIAEVIDKALQVSKKMVDVLGFWAAFPVTFLEDLRNWWMSCTDLSCPSLTHVTLWCRESQEK